MVAIICDNVHPMDVIALAFYATVCAALSYYAPALNKSVYRLLVGAIVGVAAASLLPVVKGLLAG